MNYSQRLDLRQSQSLVMTPQLQQAIKLLQMSNLELSGFVQNELDNNPLLEESFTSDLIHNEQEKRLELEHEKLLKMKQELSQDSYENSFSDYGTDCITSFQDKDGYNQLNNYQDFSGGGAGGDILPSDRNTVFVAEKNLRDTLSEQLRMSVRNPIHALVGSYLIGLIDDNGYLKETADEISAKLMMDIKIIRTVIRICQSFEPVGVFAKDLRECLRLQLMDRQQVTPAMDILLNNLPLLAQKNYNALMKLCGSSKETLIQMIDHIKSLNPKPASSFASGITQTLIPDVLIEQKNDGGWLLELNPETLPKLGINRKYTMHLGKDGTETDQYIKDTHARAAWLIKSLDQRSQTILKVSSEILRQQDGFFAYGFSHLKPMNLKRVAEELGLHESTISRVTSGKYMRCPKGIFELKFFFMSGISDSSGEQNVSSESVKHDIKKLIDSENVANILSDEDIVTLLKAKDIDIARRTVTKYREAMNIPSSVQRRRNKKSLH